MLSMQQLDSLRTHANNVIDQKRHDAARGHAAGESYALGRQLELEEAIDNAIVERARAPACPMCKSGAMEPYYDRLRCIDCGATAHLRRHERRSEES